MVMSKTRLEAFSDGVIAIIITIMVLELKIPHDPTPAGLLPLLPPFLSYVLSFIYVGIYWNNHHHLLHTLHTVNGKVLWANLHILFWLSLVPFATGWMGENHFAMLPTALYGFILLMAAIAYIILQNTILKTLGDGSVLANAVGKDCKGKVSLGLYVLALLVCPYNSWVAQACYVAVAILWFIPDRRIEKAMGV